MAKKSSVKPLISGGRTLAKLLRGSKGSGHGKPNKKATWYQLAGKVYGEQAKLGSWLVGEMPEEIRARLEGGKS